MIVDRKITMEDVAKIADVSRSTVSRVVNNDPRIPVQTVQEVRSAIEKSGYRPKPVRSRQGLRSRSRKPIRHKRVALLFAGQLSQLYSPIYSRVIHSVEERLNKDGWTLVMSTHPSDCFNGRPLPSRIDGCIFFGCGMMPSESRLLRDIRKLGGAVRIMSRPHPDDVFDHVTYNERSIGALAAGYLLNKNCRRFVAVGPPGDFRVNDFCQTVGDDVLRIDHSSLILEKGKAQSPDAETIYSIARQIKALRPLPDALFVPSDILVLGFYQALPKVGLIPGQDIEVVGVNNDAVFLDCLHPRPASVDIHAEAVGHRAVDQLFWRLDHPREPLQVVKLEPELCEGGG